MQPITHTFIFEPISDNWGKVSVDNAVTGSHFYLQVCVRDRGLLRRSLSAIPPIIADLLDIAVAVYVGDRASLNRSQTLPFIRIVLPVRCVDIFISDAVRGKLQDILYWYTGCTWEFDFIKRDSVGRIAEERPTLPLRNSITPFVSLWSGGLDALAGLFIQLIRDSNSTHVLAASGSNKMMAGKQKEIARSVKRLFPNRTELMQVPIYLKSKNGNLPDNPTLRSRGFTFMLVGVVIAYLKGQNCLNVYENGIGAINLPFRSSEIGLDHARSVHPLSLQYMSELVSLILEKQFLFQNPFLFMTKAQLCQPLIEHNLKDLAYTTVTCDRRHRKEEAQQCGRCSSCILRRQAFAFLGVPDLTEYVYKDFDIEISEPLSDDDHLPAMLYQVESFRKHLTAMNPWQSLTKEFQTLAFDIVDQPIDMGGLNQQEKKEQLLGLYQRYVYEWDHIRQNNA